MFSILEDAIDDWPEKASGGLSADISDAFVADNAENNDTETSEADENRRPGDEIQVKQPEEDGQLGSVEPLTNQSMSVRDIEDFWKGTFPVKQQFSDLLFEFLLIFDCIFAVIILSIWAIWLNFVLIENKTCRQYFISETLFIINKCFSLIKYFSSKISLIIKC